MERVRKKSLLGTYLLIMAAISPDSLAEATTQQTSLSRPICTESLLPEISTVEKKPTAAPFGKRRATTSLIAGAV